MKVFLSQKSTSSTHVAHWPLGYIRRKTWGTSDVIHLKVLCDLRCLQTQRVIPSHLHLMGASLGCIKRSIELRIKEAIVIVQ